MRCGARLSTLLCSKGYNFFEDMYPAQEPGKRFEYFEDQLDAATAKSDEPTTQVSETDRLNQLFDWKKENNTVEGPGNFGWAEEWGPEPGEDGHNDFYKKNRMYMSTDEKIKLDQGVGVPLPKGKTRHQPLPFHQKVEAGYKQLNEEKPQWNDTSTKGYFADYNWQDRKDYIADKKEDYLREWLDKPDVTPENVSKKIGDYNGTAKHHRIVPLERRPDWQLAPKESD